MATDQDSGTWTHEVTIENTIYPWSKDTITAGEIRSLANLPADRPIVKIDLIDRSEMVLEEDDVHHLPRLDPGKGIVKKVGFRAGTP